MITGSKSRASSAKGLRGGESVPERLAWVDALKGVGIVLVVIGHVWWWRGPVHELLYRFHMPLFFLLSGYTAQATTVGRLLPRLARSLLLPFLSFTLLLLAADYFIQDLRGARPMFASPGQAVLTILFAMEKLKNALTILWFVPCLFIVRLLWALLLGEKRRADDGIVLAGVALALALAVLGDLTRGRLPFGMLPAPIGLSPLGLLSVPGALVLFWGGRLWRERGHPTGLLAWGLALYALAALIWLPELNMKSGDIGLPVLSIVGAVALTIQLAWLARHFPDRLTRGFSWLGQRTLAIMFVHVAFIHYLQPYLPRLALVAVALAGGILVDALARSSRPTRLLMLGER